MVKERGSAEAIDKERQSWRRWFPTMSDGLLDMLLDEEKEEAETMASLALQKRYNPRGASEIVKRYLLWQAITTSPK